VVSEAIFYISFNIFVATIILQGKWPSPLAAIAFRYRHGLDNCIPRTNVFFEVPHALNIR